MKIILCKTLAALLCVIAIPAILAFTGGCAATATRPSTGEYIDDSTITVKVKAALVQDSVVRARDVAVTTDRGIVQLGGFVDTAEQKDRAGLLAKGVPGVQSVQNNISIR